MAKPAPRRRRRPARDDGQGVAEPLPAGTAPTVAGPSDSSSAPLTGAAGLGKTAFSRRSFLVRGSLAAGTAAVVGSLPGMGSLLTAAENSAPELEGGAGAAGAEANLAGQQIIAHVMDFSTGEINLYQGTRQVIAHSPALAQAIARLATAK